MPLGTPGVSIDTPREGSLFAIIAAIIFAIVFILDLAGKSEGNLINPGTLTALGLFFIALHLAPVRSFRWRRR
jgi:hypothetical protein